MKKRLLLGLAVAFAAPGMASAQNPEQVRERIEGTRTTIEQMVRVRTTLSETRRDWEIYQETAQRRIDLFRSERDDLRLRLEETEARTTEAERRIAAIREDIDAVRAANRSIQEALPGLEARLREIAQYFPRPLRNRTERLIGQLGRSQQASDRMAVVVGLLNEADRFNSLFTVDVDERRLDDGEIVSVDVIYIGLAFAYYVDREGNVAGYGVPADGGWEWTEQTELVGPVRRAVEFYAGRVKPAQAVRLPVRITDVTIGD
ncbi:MAG: DUF3450 family protein [Opitutales bacterium]|nr:DUF3450 family protein [Opitutales bacterium]